MEDENSRPVPVDWEQLIREISPRLKLFISHRRFDGIVDDVVQETLLRVFTQYRNFKVSEGRLTAWLFAVARKVLIDHGRRVRKEIAAACRARPAPCVRAVSAALDAAHRFLRAIGRIVQSAFNAARRRATFHRWMMARGDVNILATHRACFRFMAHIHLAPQPGIPVTGLSVAFGGGCAPYPFRPHERTPNVLESASFPSRRKGDGQVCFPQLTGPPQRRCRRTIGPCLFTTSRGSAGFPAERFGRLNEWAADGVSGRNSDLKVAGRRSRGRHLARAASKQPS